MRRFFLVVFAILLLAGCAGPNPNVGERTTDYAWLEGRYADAFNTVKPHAEAGEPWAQLRLGMFYSNGWGTEKNFPRAIQWFEKAAAQKTEGEWAEGKMVGAMGRNGYFNQNSDARIAQLKLAIIYLVGAGGSKDLVKAYMNIRAVIEETKGRSLFFCCEFAGGRAFPAKQIADTYQAVLKEMTSEQKVEAEEKFEKQRRE